MERAELDKRKSEAEQPEREAKERHEKAWEGKQGSYVKLLAPTFLFPGAKSLNGQVLHPELSFPGSFVPSNFHSLGTLIPECSVLGIFAPLCLYCDVMQHVFYVGLLNVNLF